MLDPRLVKGPWTKEEDVKVMELVKELGPKKWSAIADHLPGRIGKQCRERWHNHLNPDIRKDAWTPEEDAVILRLVFYVFFFFFSSVHPVAFLPNYLPDHTLHYLPTLHLHREHSRLGNRWAEIAKLLKGR